MVKKLQISTFKVVVSAKYDLVGTLWGSIIIKFNNFSIKFENQKQIKTE